MLKNKRFQREPKQFWMPINWCTDQERLLGRTSVNIGLFYAGKDIYVSIHEGASVNQFEMARRIAKVAVVFAALQQQRPDYEPRVGDFEPSTEAQLLVADSVNHYFADYFVVRAIGTFNHNAACVFYCKSRVSYLPNIELWVPADVTMEQFNECHRIALDAVQHYQATQAAK